MDRRNSFEQTAQTYRNGDIAKMGDMVVRYQDGAWVPETTPRRSQIIGGVEYVEQADGTWSPQGTIRQPEMPRHEQPASLIQAAPLPLGGETSVRQEHVEELRRILAAGPDAQRALEQRLSVASEQLAEQEAILAARAAEKENMRGQQALHVVSQWNPERTPSMAVAHPSAYVAPQVAPMAVKPQLAPEYQPAVRPETMAEATEELAKKPRKLRKVMAIAAISGVAATGIGGVAFTNGYPMKWFADNSQNAIKPAAEDGVRLPLSAAKKELIDAFGGCIDEQGNGPTLVSADVVSGTDTLWPMTDANKKQVLLAASDKSTGRTSIKPEVKLTDAKVAYTACVTATDREGILTIDDATNTITVNESLVSPQGTVAVHSFLRGLMLNENDNSTALDTISVIDQLVTAKVLTADEGKRLKDAYAADATAKEEARLAAGHTAVALAQPDSLYARQTKAALEAAIQDALTTKVQQLHDQGAISTSTVHVKLSDSMSRPIAMKNSTTPAANMPFTETDSTRILTYTPTEAKK